MLPGRLASDGQVCDRRLAARPCTAATAATGTARLNRLPCLGPIDLPAALCHALSQWPEDGSTAAWSIADDVFQARYQAGGSHTEGAWQPLPQLSLQLEAPPAAGGGGGAGSAAGGARQRRGGSAAAAAALPADEPWLLAAAAYAAEGGALAVGRTATTRARMLFQYKPYSQQEPLAASEAEVAAVVDAVFGRLGPGPSAFEVRPPPCRCRACPPVCHAPRLVPLGACRATCSAVVQQALPACLHAAAWPLALTRQMLPSPRPAPQGEQASLWDVPAASEAAFGLAPAAAPTGEAAAVILVKLVMDM